MPSTTLAIAADCKVFEVDPGTNYNSSDGANLDIFNNGIDDRRSWLRFADLSSSVIPAGATIVSATLALDMTAVPSPFTGDIQAVVADSFGFVETSITWANQPTWSDPARATSAGRGATAVGAYSLNIKEVVAWFQANARSTGVEFVLKAATESTGPETCRFSDRTTGSPPTLTIVYSVPGGDGVRYEGYKGRVLGRERR